MSEKRVFWVLDQPAGTSQCEESKYISRVDRRTKRKGLAGARDPGEDISLQYYILVFLRFLVIVNISKNL